MKVELTKEEKRLIGRHSSPRWELDIVGYSARVMTFCMKAALNKKTRGTTKGSYTSMPGCGP